MNYGLPHVIMQSEVNLPRITCKRKIEKCFAGSIQIQMKANSQTFVTSYRNNHSILLPYLAFTAICVFQVNLNHQQFDGKSH